MERQSPKRMKSQYLCIPKLGTIKSSRLSPTTLLECFREAVFCLMMMSALSKASHGAAAGSPVIKRTYYPADLHYNAAVADCIEFIKKTTLIEEKSRDSTVSNRIDSTTELTIFVAVK